METCVGQRGLVTPATLQGEEKLEMPFTVKNVFFPRVAFRLQYLCKTCRSSLPMCF